MFHLQGAGGSDSDDTDDDEEPRLVMSAVATGKDATGDSSAKKKRGNNGEREMARLKNIQNDYKYAVALFEDVIVSIPTDWFRYDRLRGWGAVYPYNKAKPHHYVSVRKDLLPQNLKFRWYRIRRAPHNSECAKGT